MKKSTAKVFSIHIMNYDCYDYAQMVMRVHYLYFLLKKIFSCKGKPLSMSIHHDFTYILSLNMADFIGTLMLFN
jgi:hypothetical protein